MENNKDKYVQGKLSEEERMSFENELTAEETKELAFELGVRKGVEESAGKELRNKVAQFESRRSKGRIRPWQLGIAASILLIATFTFLLTNGDKDLYTSYYEPYPNYEVTSLRGVDKETLRAQAFKAYDEKNFALASDRFAELLEAEPEDAPSQFFYGIALMEEGNFEEALINFNFIIKKGSSDYLNPSKWYSALCYISLENNDAAISLLNQLADSEEFGQKAKTLKEEL